MTTSHRRKLAFRIGLTAGAVTALFWTVWYLVFGSVPGITAIPITPDWSYTLPFVISHWWDIPSVMILSALIVLLVPEESEGERGALALGLILGLVYGLISGLIVGLAPGLAFALVVGLISGLSFGLVFGLVVGLSSGLTSGLVVGLSSGLTSGLALGLAFGLVYVCYNIEPLAKSAGNWILAR